jgi:hypothetical protein
MATKRPDSIEEYQRKRAAKRAVIRRPPRTHNQPSDLPALNEQRHVYVEQARASLGILRKTFETWVGVGQGLKVLHDFADEIGGKKTYDKLREREGLGRDVINKSRSSRLLAIIDNLPAVEEWRATLTPKQRFEWASPEAVHRHCPVFAKDKPQRVDKPASPAEQDRMALAAALEEIAAHETAPPKVASSAASASPKKTKSPLVLKEVGSTGIYRADGDGASYDIRLQQGMNVTFGGGKAKDYKEWGITKDVGKVKVPWKFVPYKKDEPDEKRKARGQANKKAQEESLQKALALAQRDYERYE